MSVRPRSARVLPSPFLLLRTAPRWIGGRLRRLWQRRFARFWLLWAGVALFVALDDVPSEFSHFIAAPIVVAGAVALTQWRLWRWYARHTRYFSDTILALRRHADTYERDATTDRLTGLANRAAFFSEFEHVLEDTRLYPAPNAGALLVLDLNFFKQINDTWGHHVGDLALQRLARVLREETRHHDLVARLGGDEFAVLVRPATLADGRRLALRIERAAAAKPLHRQGGMVYLSLCVGVAPLADHDEVDAALIAADRALYAAKERVHQAQGAA